MPRKARSSAMSSRILGARYRRILSFFAQVISSLVLWELILPRVGFGWRSRQTRPARLRRAAVRFRALAIQMGGVMIKVGQFLSSRLDVLPPEITDELAGLQDEVPPASFPGVRALAEAELGTRLEETYATFEETPLAAASLGQVHRATLHPAGAISTPAGPITAVVAKIQRPGIEQLVETDLAALRQVARWVQRYPGVRRRADVPALMEEFSRITSEELDYLAEGRNAEALAANLAKRPGVRMPKVDWGHTTRRVLTLEDVYAIKVTDYEAITAAGISRSAVARRLARAYLQQIFEDGFFHADPHPGNLFVQRLADDTAEGWQLTFVDFGMVGRISPGLRAGLREMLIAAVTRDAPRLVQAFQATGVLLPGGDRALLEQAELRFFALFGGKSMAELQRIDREQMQQFAEDYRELIYDLPFQIPNNLLLLGRTVGILSGMCTGLDPDFNVWQELEPYVEKLLVAEGAPAARQVLSEVGRIVSALAAIPIKTDRLLGEIERDGVIVRTPDLTRLIGRLERRAYQLVMGIVFAAFLLGAVQMELGQHRVSAILLAVMAAITLLWLMVPHRH